MIARTLILTSLCAVAVAADAPPAQPAPPAAPAAATAPAAAKTWLDQVPALRSGDGGKRAFQFRKDIDVAAEQLVAYVSFTPPDRACVIFCDRVDGTPLMVAVDGRMWLYDAIGGQIVRTGGGPHILTNADGQAVRTAWGLRTTFPDPASRTTIDVDFASVVKALAPPAEPPRLTAEGKRRVASVKNGNIEVVLAASAADPPVPVSFDFRSTNATPGIALRFDSFVLDAPPPAWHKAVDEAALAKHVTVVDLDESEKLPPKTQAKLVKFKSLLNGNGLFILRTALRDDALRDAIEKNSRLRLDFEEIRANDKHLAGAWIKALAEQGIKFPAPPGPATKPAAKPAAAGPAPAKP